MPKGIPVRGENIVSKLKLLEMPRTLLWCVPIPQRTCKPFCCKQSECHPEGGVSKATQEAQSP